jgi:hypothetical protein
MSTRKVKDAEDINTKEKVYLKGHAKVTYMSDGISVEDTFNRLIGDSKLNLDCFIPLSRDFSDDFNDDFAR